MATGIQTIQLSVGPASTAWSDGQGITFSGAGFNPVQYPVSQPAGSNCPSVSVSPLAEPNLNGTGGSFNVQLTSTGGTPWAIQEPLPSWIYLPSTETGFFSTQTGSATVSFSYLPNSGGPNSSQTGKICFVADCSVFLTATQGGGVSFSPSAGFVGAGTLPNTPATGTVSVAAPAGLTWTAVVDQSDNLSVGYQLKWWDWKPGPRTTRPTQWNGRTTHRYYPHRRLELLGNPSRSFDRVGLYPTVRLFTTPERNSFPLWMAPVIRTMLRGHCQLDTAASLRRPIPPRPPPPTLRRPHYRVDLKRLL